MDLGDYRREYISDGLQRKDCHANPIEQFKKWVEQAHQSGLRDVTSMTLSTVDASGQPQQRIVLLKRFDRSGFVFFTNYASAKAHEMNDHPQVSLHFSWLALERQVQILGVADQTPQSMSQDYFESRPRDSQIAAWASKQSKPIHSRAELNQQFEDYQRKFAGNNVPLPDFWGGYRIVPTQIEFWQGGVSRLHDRMVYTQEGEDLWSLVRLAP